MAGWVSVGCPLNLSFMSERFSRKGVDEWVGVCSLITSEATNAKRNKQMKHEKISQSIQKAHDGAAFEVALNYLRNLEKDTDNTLGTMSGLVEAFRYDISEKVCRRARFLGASNCKYRPELVLMLAKDYVREALRANPEQADKLQAIRSAQDWKARAEAMAEQAKWVPVPVD